MADWQGQGRKAGPIRNQRMLDFGRGAARFGRGFPRRQMHGWHDSAALQSWRPGNHAMNGQGVHEPAMFGLLRIHAELAPVERTWPGRQSIASGTGGTPRLLKLIFFSTTVQGGGNRRGGRHRLPNALLITEHRSAGSISNGTHLQICKIISTSTTTAMPAINNHCIRSDLVMRGGCSGSGRQRRSRPLGLSFHKLPPTSRGATQRDSL
jgi:hypothetical protein